MDLKKQILAAVSALGLMLTACATAEAEQNRYEGMDKDEAGLWYVMDKFEQEVKTSGIRVNDPGLETYVRDLTCKIVGEECDKLRIYIVDSPEFNASMAPNGMMMVNSGLLLRAENEAQLGCVLGHEYGHFQKGHSLKMWRRMKNLQYANFISPYAGLVGMAALANYSQDYEKEADVVGFDSIDGKGYDPHECADVWGNLIGENSASVVKARRRNSNSSRTGVFSSHPVPKVREQYLKEMADAAGTGTQTGEAIFKMKTDPYLGRWMERELMMKDYDRHIYLFEELDERGRKPGVVNYYIGEAYRQRRDDGDLDKAMEHWKKASLHSDAPAETWRSMAEYHRKQGRKAEAVADYQAYLRKDPAANDRKLVEKYIERLQGG